MTREPEMVKAYRDTWELGLHSYLTYLRDRLLLCRDLLTTSGSIFVQISDENLHHVREVMEEVFGAENFVGMIPFLTTSSQTAEGIGSVADYLIWFAKSREQMKYRQLYLPKDPRATGGWGVNWASCPANQPFRHSENAASGKVCAPGVFSSVLCRVCGAVAGSASVEDTCSSARRYSQVASRCLHEYAFFPCVSRVNASHVQESGAWACTSQVRRPVGSLALAMV